MKVSLVIASHQEGRLLLETVRACREQLADTDHEIVLADDASTDGSVDQVQQSFPDVIVTRSAVRRGASPTKHAGALTASGDTLIFLDAHCRPEPGALMRLIDDVALTRGEAIVTPAIAHLDTENFVPKNNVYGHGYSTRLDNWDCRWLPLSQLQSRVVADRKFFESPSLIGCAFAITRDTYARLGGFDTQMKQWGIEDVEFGVRAWMSGVPILHDARTVIAHRFRMSFDTYQVDPVSPLANSIRASRKLFGNRNFDAWTEAARLRALARGEESVWEQAWARYCDDAESAISFSRELHRTRKLDEYAYAARFQLDWPAVSEEQEFRGDLTLEDANAVAGLELLSEQVSPSASPSPSLPPDDDPEEDEEPKCELGQGPLDGLTAPLTSGNKPSSTCDDCKAGAGSPTSTTQNPVQFGTGKVILPTISVEPTIGGQRWRQSIDYSNHSSTRTSKWIPVEYQLERLRVKAEHHVSHGQDANGNPTSSESIEYKLFLDHHRSAGSGSKELGHWYPGAAPPVDVVGDHWRVFTDAGDELLFTQMDHPATPQSTPPSRLTSANFANGVAATITWDDLSSFDATVTAVELCDTSKTRHIIDRLNYTTQSYRLESVTYSRSVDGGNFVNLRRVEVEAYDPFDEHGDSADIKHIREVSFYDDPVEPKSVNTWSFRYWTVDNGGRNLVKSVVRPANQKRLADLIDQEEVGSFDELTDAALDTIVDTYYEYDEQRRCNREETHGRSQITTFSYELNPSGSIGPNEWFTKTTVQLPDPNSSEIIYSNAKGATILRESRQGTYRQYEYAEYTSGGQPTKYIGADGLTGYVVQGNAIVPSEGPGGMVQLAAYVDDTTSPLNRYITKEEFRASGTSDTPTVLKEYVYTLVTESNDMFPVLASVHGLASDGSLVETTYDVAFHSGTRVPSAITRTRNGEIPRTVSVVLDESGRPMSRTDELGVTVTCEYDDFSQTITSVTGAGPGDSTSIVDRYGRVLEVRGPLHSTNRGDGHRTTWTVYEPNRTLSVSGFSDAQSEIPETSVSIVVTNESGNVTERIEAELPGSGLVRDRLKTFQPTQDQYLRWSTTHYTECCRLHEERTYHAIPTVFEGIDSNPGLPTTHYARISYSYDGLRRLNKTISADGLITRRVFDVAGRLSEEWVGTSDFNATDSDPSGGNTPGNDMELRRSFEYDTNETTGAGHMTRMFLHLDGGATEQQASAYDALGRRSQVIGNDDVMKQDFFDATGRVTKSQVLGPETNGSRTRLSETLSTFDRDGQLVEKRRVGVDIETGLATGTDDIESYLYDVAGRLIRRTPDAVADFRSFAYDHVGQVVEEAGPIAGEQLTHVYDAAGNRVETVTPATTNRPEVDALGRTIAERTVIDPNDASQDEVSQTEYGPTGEILSTTDPLGHMTHYMYDVAGRQLSMTDAENRATNYTYDVQGRLQSVIWPDAGVETYTYDVLGRWREHTRQDDTTIRLEMDRGGRVAVRRYLDEHGTEQDIDTFAYDQRGRLLSAHKGRYVNTVSFGYDPLGRITTETLAFGPQANPTESYEILQSYDGLGRLIGITDPEGVTIERRYGSTGARIRQLTGLERAEADGQGGVDRKALSSWVHDAAGRPVERRDGLNGAHGHSLMTYTAGQLASAMVYDGQGVNIPELSRLYSYDNAGRVVNERTAMLSTGHQSGWDATHDRAGRLTAWIHYGNDGQVDQMQQWTVSPCGNWDSFIGNSVFGDGTQTRVHGPAHETLTVSGPTTSGSFTYDGRGQMTSDPLGRQFRWDPDGLLASVTIPHTCPIGVEGSYTYAHDAIGRLVLKSSDGSSTLFVNRLAPLPPFRSSGGQTLCEYTDGELSKRFAYSSYVDSLAYVETPESSTHIFNDYRHSTLGGTRAHQGGGSAGSLVGTSQTSLYGTAVDQNATSESVPRERFVGRPVDIETGTGDFRARSWCPELGRFLSRDNYPDPAVQTRYSSLTHANAIDPTGGYQVRNDDIDRECQGGFKRWVLRNVLLKPYLDLLRKNKCELPKFSCYRDTDENSGTAVYSVDSNTLEVNLEKIQQDNGSTIIEHELIHAVDGCTGFLDNAGCRTAVCAEMRAYSCSLNCAAGDAKSRATCIFRGVAVSTTLPRPVGGELLEAMCTAEEMKSAYKEAGLDPGCNCVKPCLGKLPRPSRKFRGEAP